MHLRTLGSHPYLHPGRSGHRDRLGDDAVYDAFLHRLFVLIEVLSGAIRGCGEALRPMLLVGGGSLSFPRHLDVCRAAHPA